MTLQYEVKIQRRKITLPDGTIVDYNHGLRGPSVYTGKCILLAGRLNRDITPIGVKTSLADLFNGEMFVFSLDDGRFFRAGISPMCNDSPDVEHHPPVMLSRDEAEELYSECEKAGEVYAPFPEVTQ